MVTVRDDALSGLELYHCTLQFCNILVNSSSAVSLAPVASRRREYDSPILCNFLCLLLGFYDALTGSVYFDTRFLSVLRIVFV